MVSPFFFASLSGRLPLCRYLFREEPSNFTIMEEKVTEISCENQGEFSNSFILQPDGLFEKGEEGQTVRITWTPFRVISRARTPEGNGWSFIVAVQNLDGGITEVPVSSVDLLGKGGAGLKLLVDAGVEICPGGEETVVFFIRCSKPRLRDLMVQSSGWVEGRNLYVTPRKVIGNSGDERILYRPEANSPTENSMTPKGTLAEWQAKVASLAVGNPLLVFSIAVGFTGMLLRLLGLDGGGFNFFGLSSRGKTTLLQMGSSVLGNGCDPASKGDSYVRRWNLTGNAAEALGAAHNDGLLVLDELGTFTGNDIDSLVYNLSGGTGKSAMTSQRTLRRQRAWLCTILSSGEVSYLAKATASGRQVMAGQLIRLLDVAIGETIFHATGGMPPADFANCIKKACATWYGTAGPAFAEKLIEQLDEDADSLRESLTEALEQFTSELTPQGLQPEQARAIRRFALVRLAGELAVQFGILPFADADILEAVTFARDSWLSSFTGISESDRGIQALQSFIVRNHSSFSSIRNKSAKVSNSKGFFNPDNGWYLFTDEQLRAAAGGCEPKDLVRALRSKNLLICHEGGRLKVKQKIASMADRWTRFYAIKTSIVELNLENTEGETGGSVEMPGGAVKPAVQDIEEFEAA